MCANAMVAMCNVFINVIVFVFIVIVIDDDDINAIYGVNHINNNNCGSVASTK